MNLTTNSMLRHAPVEPTPWSAASVQRCSRRFSPLSFATSFPRSGHRLFQPIADISTAPQHTFSVLIGAKANLFMRMKVTNPNP
jgi:hypothetical protein